MCKTLCSVLVVLALALASCDGNPFGSIEATYDSYESAGEDTAVQPPEPDTSQPPVFVCEDNDGDNFCANAQNELERDCNDNAKSVHPGATEVCDSVDQNCNGLVDEATGSVWYLDADGDGHGDPSESISDGCDGASFLVAIGDDCDDEDADINPDATEICNGKDDDCDEDIDDEDASLDKSTAKTWYVDEDGDGFGDDSGAFTFELCEKSANYLVENQDDCDDNDDASYPDADEVCDEKDNDCDGLSDEGVQTFSYLDDDEDGFGNAFEVNVGCGVPDGYVLNKTDCDDSESHTYPDSGEICDGVDNDCDGKIDEVAPDENMCDDNDALTIDSCEGVDGCTYEDVMFEFECELPDEFQGDDFICGSALFFEPTADEYGAVLYSDGSLSMPASGLCALLESGQILHVNGYVFEEGNPFVLWVGGQYVTVTDSLTNIKVNGTPGDVTILVPGLDFLFTFEDFELCQ